LGKGRASVTNDLNANVAHVGGDGQGALALKIMDNGAGTLNTINADLNNYTELIKAI